MLDDERFYQQALDELRAEGPREALWFKALSMVGGASDKAQIAYVKLRVGQLKAEDVKRQGIRLKEVLINLIIFFSGVAFLGFGLFLIVMIHITAPEDFAGRELWIFMAPFDVGGIFLIAIGVLALRSVRKRMAENPENVVSLPAS